ncbi:protein LATERAL ROOT PRIMORDIUM 1 isoform X2 [Arachis ipaensis]|uniref:protein LATERAL ROOT PRIMORDIUM 1 isoform X2 n=1 Tax=Arachis ipaensis TaxID=130454 RepID=UPI0007AFCBE9|nr:protein LATERAL ROOT PRIMORDIUM 1 isoform X2 [Arachis ipaensis]QHN97530.1 Protein LATERAL ROOT PRIMORDIUM [Arachis hypogaea]
MNMLGLRDLVFIAPTHSLHHHHQQGQTIISQDNHHSHGHTNTTNNNDNNNNNNLPFPPSSLSVGLGIFPLITATPCMPQDNNNNVHHDQQHLLVGTNTTTTTNNSYWNLKMCPEVSEHDGGGGDGNNNGDGGGGSIYGPEFRVCQDCGNRAKKDCSYKRCRTCCKGRGYDCSTHVKSTWVPVSHRRARDMAVVAASDGGGAAAALGANKRLRAFGSSQTTTTTNTSHSSTSNATTTKNAEFKQSLPSHVRAPAAFRCHRVSAISNGEDEITYLATVHICGHVFKGFLYDQGADGKNDEVPCVSVLQLGNSGKNNNNGECSSPTPIGVPISAYPASAC